MNSQNKIRRKHFFLLRKICEHFTKAMAIAKDRECVTGRIKMRRAGQGNVCIHKG